MDWWVKVNNKRVLSIVGQGLNKDSDKPSPGLIALVKPSLTGECKLLMMGLEPTASSQKEGNQESRERQTWYSYLYIIYLHITKYYLDINY